MSLCICPTRFSLEGDIGENWRKFKQCFDTWLKASGHESDSSDQKANLLLGSFDEDALDWFNTFQLSDTDRNDFDKVIEAFEKFAYRKMNVVEERFHFNTRVQGASENFDDFYIDLILLADTCEFGDQENSIIRDRIVVGVSDRSLQEQLLQEEDLSLTKTVVLCRASEPSERMDETAQESASRKSTDTNKPPSQQLPRPPTSREVSSPGLRSSTSREVSSPRSRRSTSREVSSPRSRRSTSREVSSPRLRPSTSHEVSSPRSRRSTSHEVSSPRSRRSTSREVSIPRSRPSTSHEVSSPRSRPSTSPEVSSRLSDRLEACISKAYAVFPILNREDLDAFLIRSKRRRKPEELAKNFTNDVKGLKKQLELIIHFYLKLQGTGTEKDKLFIYCLRRLVNRFEEKKSMSRTSFWQYDWFV